MKELRLWFSHCDDRITSYFRKMIGRHYRLAVDPQNPEFLIVGTARLRKGEQAHFDYPNAVKIFFTGENVVPDFNLFDYAMGFHYLTFGDRYMRYPLWLLYLSLMDETPLAVQEGERKFCNFVYSNNLHSDPVRGELFNLIDGYKAVDSGGSFRNNLGYRVGDKLDFIRGYKFTIAVENSSVPGYTTEKLLEPSMVGSMPIYWGDPEVGRDFNTDRFVWVRSTEPEDMTSALEEIKYLDTHPDAYAAKMAQPVFTGGKSRADWERELMGFLSNIFDQPHHEAFRRIEYGFNRHQVQQKERADIMSRSLLYNKAFGAIERLTKKRQKPTHKK